MNQIIIVLLLVLISAIPAQAETGIVLNATDEVQYKYDTPEPPVLQPGEHIVPYDDINSVKKGAKYQDGVFVNPVQPGEPVYEETLVATSGLDPTTQAAISAITGAGAAYLVVRRKKA